jgi:acyl-CoA synthetase (AMP-forming)/AMP-acid ligase II
MSLPAARTIVDVLDWRARQSPDQPACTFLVDGDTDETSLTYGELDRRARVIAAQLHAVCTPGARALLLYPPGLEYIAAFFGCLYAGVAAVPAYPPRADHMLSRLEALVIDAQATVALTTTKILAIGELAIAQAPALRALRWITTDEVVGAPAGSPRPDLTRSSLAFLQYTSGATARPRGVMLSHGNLLDNLALFAEQMEFTRDDLVVSWLPPYHDLGLIGGILAPLYVGFPCVLMSPVSFLQHPFRWLRAVSRFRATCTGAPNFAYELCIRKISPEQRAELDLSGCRLAVTAGEPVRASTLDRFVEAFARCGFRREAFRPCYGLAEATLVVSCARRSALPVVVTLQRAALRRHEIVRTTDGADAVRLVGCGPSLARQRVLVVDPALRTPCAPDRVGEIWVAGPSIATGYWNRPEETRETFCARLALSDDGPFLRTGDLGFVEGDELVVTGRIKDVLLIRGRNHYPQDIELTVERSHPALRPGCGAAFSVEVDGDERLVVIQELSRHHGSGLDDVVAAIRRAVAEQHGLLPHAIILVEERSIPKTSSGKIERHACRTAFLEESLEIVHPPLVEAPG